MGDVRAPRADSALDSLVFVATKSGSVEIADPFIEFIAIPSQFSPPDLIQPTQAKACATSVFGVIFSELTGAISRTANSVCKLG